MPNQAELDGWVKSTDPGSGRVFYANHITRVTQWDPPQGWTDELSPPPPPPSASNWEVMQDPTTGRPFYVDHARQITTWNKPAELMEQPRTARAATSPYTTQQTTTNPYAPTAAISSQINPYALQRQTSNSSLASSRSATSRQTTYNPRKSWQDNPSAYFQPAPLVRDVDFSDSLVIAEEFQVRTVEDALRLTCPSCDTPFTLSKRRHHCRLCGDVFCHECSAHRVELPLDGPEFEKPVRVCDLCHQDVDRGNFFSMRRYLTPLTLHQPGKEELPNSVASEQNVAAALASMCTDLEGMLTHSAEFQSKMTTIPPSNLIPNITKHLTGEKTSGWAVRCLAALLALGGIVGNTEYAHCVYLYGGSKALSDILGLLERSGSDRKTLYIQEQAARLIFYLSDASVLSSLQAKHSSLQNTYADKDFGSEDSLDIPRALRAMLDHSSNAKNPNLQRWATSSIRGLVKEDERRTTLSANDIAAAVASGEEQGAQAQLYPSFLQELISTGGIMILCSLIGATDSDTRAHATGALGAILESTRSIDNSLNTLFDMTGGLAGRKSQQEDDGSIIRAIVQGGGCGNSLAQMLLSADNTVAKMGADFCAALVGSLLRDPRGTATLPEGYSCPNDLSGLGACREVAFNLANGPCLPALLSLMRDPELGGRMRRPMDLKQVTMETLAAIVLAVSEMSKAAPKNCEDAIFSMNEEGVVPVMLAVLDSSSSQTLGGSRDSPSSRIREAAGICLASMAVCSGDAMEELQSCHAISAMLSNMSDTSTSTMRGDGAPRCLGMLQTAAALLTFSQHVEGMPHNELVDNLLECVDAGAISVLSKLLYQRMDWEAQDAAVGAMKARDACCRMLTSMFGIASTDEMSRQRLWNVIDADAYERNPPRNIVTAVLGVLQLAGGHARNVLMGARRAGPHYQAALMDLVEAALYAVGSMCGSNVVPGMEHTLQSQQLLQSTASDKENRRKEACSIACDILVHRSSRQHTPLLPTMLVGGFGERTLNSALRLALAIAQNGNKEQHAKLAASGVLVPISDSLRNALARQDLFRFSACLALVRFCGPHVGAGNIASVQEAIRVATSVLTLPADPHQPQEQLETTENLKASCISTLEALSSNASLWSSISKDALPSIVTYLHSSCDLGGVDSPARRATLSAALRAIVRIIQQPSHAVASARAGLAEPLARLIIGGTQGSSLEIGDDEMPLLALEVLHVMARNGEARRAARLFECGVIESVCCALAKSATDKPKKPTDGRADVAYWGLEILHEWLNDMGGVQTILQQPFAHALVEVITRDPNFVRALCSTLLLRTGMKFDKFDSETKELMSVPRIYGPPLVLVKEECAGFANTHAAALNTLFTISVLDVALESNKVWDIMLLENAAGSEIDDSQRLAGTFCAHFLRLLMDDNEDKLFVPSDPRLVGDFNTISRPLVRHSLLDGLKNRLATRINDSYMISMLVAFEVPRVCLSVWKDPALVDAAFGLVRLMVDSHEDDLIHIFVESKETLLSLFDLLNADSEVETTGDQAEEIRGVVASILGSLAENGLLTESVEKFGVRSAAIAALAAACLADERVSVDEDEDQLATSATMSSRCMQCLVELLDGGKGKKMSLSAGEAEAIAQRLGQKICHMVISRFLERAKLDQYDLEDDEDVMEAPDVKMLCAVAQHGAALKLLASIGGLHALSLIAAEGELSAILALKTACEEKPSILIDVNGHVSVMKLISEDDSINWRDEAGRRKIETAVFGLLTDMCESAKGRRAVATAEQCADCIAHAAHAIGALVEAERPDEIAVGGKNKDNAGVAAGDETNDTETDGEEGEEEEKEEVEASAEKSDDPETPLAVQPAPPKYVRKKSSTDTELESAALSFLAKVVSVESCRQTLMLDKHFIATLSLLAKDTTSFELQLQTTGFLGQVAPFATALESEGTVSTTELAEAFIEVLRVQAIPRASSSQGSKSNINSLKSIAAQGLGVIFDDTPEEHQLEAMQAVIASWMAIIKKNTVQRNTGSESDRKNSGMLAYDLSVLIARSSSKNCLRKLLSDMDLLKSMVHVVEWRYDSKASADDQVYWEASVSNSIQLLSKFICATEESQESHGISVKALASTILTMARPGKAPRKACDFATALRRLVEAKRDFAGAVAAERILARILD